ncbi:MAG TPA: O-antigen ligase family protein [Methylomirabilota bacterium]|jgi:O-antigen ligase
MIIFYLVVSVMPFVRHPFWSLFVGSLTIVKIAGLVCVGYALLYSNVRRTRPDYFRTWQARLTVTLCFMGMASYVIIGSRIPFDVSPFLSYLSFLMFFYVTLTVVDSAARLRWVMLVASGSMAYASIHVLREWQNSGFDYGYRPGWVTGDPNYFSLSALLGLPFAFYLMRTRQPTWERNFCIGCLGLTLIGLALAASRGGLLGLAASVMVVAWRSKHRVKVMSAAVALLIPLMILSPSSPIGRLLNPTFSDRDSADSRLILWTAGLKMMRQHPLFGVGVGNYKEALDSVLEPGMSIRFSVAHNTYIQVGSELGIVGLGLFVGIILMTLRSTERIRRAARRARVPLVGQAAEAIQVGLVGFSVSITFVSAEYHKFFWLVVFLTCCLPALMRPKPAGRPWWARGAPRGDSARPLPAPSSGPTGDSAPAPGAVGSPSP